MYLLKACTDDMDEWMDGWMDGWSAYFDENNFQPQGRDCILRILVHCDKADSEPPLSAPQYLNIV